MTSSEPARIAFVCDFNAHGGTQTHLLHLLAGLDRKRFDPVLVTLNLDRALGDRLRESRIEVIDLALRGAFRLSSLAAVLGLARRLRRGAARPALLHGFLYQGNLLTALLSRLTGIPFVTSVRNRDIWKRGRHRILSGLAHRRALRVIFNSAAVREETLRLEPVAKRKAVVIVNGVADPGRAPRPSDRPAATLLCVASLREKKGHVHLLEAFRRVRAACPGARLLLAGEGPLRGALEDRVRALGLEGAVTFLGYSADIPGLLGQADLFVLASLEEGMPNALLEAMAAGLPSVVTAVGGNPEAVAEGVTGFLVPASDPEAMAGRVVELLRDPDRARSMGAAARRRFEEGFSVQRMIAAYEDLYAGILP